MTPEPLYQKEERQLTEDERQFLEACYRMAESDDGGYVLDTMERLFIGLHSSALLEELAEDVPHPYRAYLIQGMQRVVMFLRTQAAMGDGTTATRTRRMSDPVAITDDDEEIMR